MESNYKELIDDIDDRRSTTNPQLSMIVLTCNRPLSLFECLNSLKKQRMQEFDTIVVDNGESKFVRKDLEKYNVLYLKMKRNYPVSLSRNAGCFFAKSRYVGFVDDDVVCDDMLTKNVLETFHEYSHVFAIRGKIIPKSNSIFNKMQSHYDLGDRPLYGYFHESCYFFHRKVVLEISNYDERIYEEGLLQGHEGMQVIYRMCKKYGIQAMLYQPSIVVYHDYASGLKHYLRKKKNHKRAIENYRLHAPEVIHFFEGEYKPEKGSIVPKQTSLFEKIAKRSLDHVTKIYLKL